MDIKDYYSFMIKPTENEIRNEGLIDKLCGIMTLKVPKNVFYENYGFDNSLNTGLITWKNQLIALKYYYATAKKYFKYYGKSEDYFKKSSFDYWCRKNIEIVIILLYSQYDKALNIVNSLFDLRVKRRSRFKFNIISQLEKISLTNSNINEFFNVLKKVDSDFNRLINDIRNNVIHNYCDLYPSFEINIDDKGKELWIRNDGITLEEGFTKIEECVNSLEILMVAINSELIKKYNNTESKDYNRTDL